MLVAAEQRNECRKSDAVEIQKKNQTAQSQSKKPVPPMQRKTPEHQRSNNRQRQKSALRPRRTASAARDFAGACCMCERMRSLTANPGSSDFRFASFVRFFLSSPTCVGHSALYFYQTNDLTYEKAAPRKDRIARRFCTTSVRWCLLYFPILLFHVKHMCIAPDVSRETQRKRMEFLRCIRWKPMMLPWSAQVTPA